jgi:cohesin domain-containing protein
VTLQVILQNISTPVSGASFRLNYDTNALRLLSSASYHLGPIVPGNALAVWNVGPQQNNFAAQNGTLSLAASSAGAWSSNQGVLAEITFQVQNGATNQYLWPVTLSGVETTEDGYVNHQLSAAGAGISVRSAVAGGLSVNGHIDANGAFAMTLAGDAGASYQIQVSDDLKHWIPLTTVVNSNGSTQFSDPDAGGHDHRFYKAVPAE